MKAWIRFDRTTSSGLNMVKPSQPSRTRLNGRNFRLAILARDCLGPQKSHGYPTGANTLACSNRITHLNHLKERTPPRSIGGHRRHLGFDWISEQIGLTSTPRGLRLNRTNVTGRAFRISSVILADQIRQNLDTRSQARSDARRDNLRIAKNQKPACMAKRSTATADAIPSKTD